MGTMNFVVLYVGMFIIGLWRMVELRVFDLIQVMGHGKFRTQRPLRQAHGLNMITVKEALVIPFFIQGGWIQRLQPKKRWLFLTYHSISQSLASGISASVRTIT